MLCRPETPENRVNLKLTINSDAFPDRPDCFRAAMEKRMHPLRMIIGAASIEF